MAEAAVAAWTTLGFDVEIVKRGTIVNNDYYKWTDSVPEDICDDLYMEDIISGSYEVAAMDMGALTMDAFATLAPFAKAFSGQAIDISGNDDEYELTPHITGYNSEAYNKLMNMLNDADDVNKVYTNVTLEA